MKVVLWTIICCVAPALVGLVVSTDQLEARSKPGPVTVRGLASGIHANSFTLKTRTHGSYLVTSTASTQVTEKGRKGRLSVREGDHVGVRGFVQGRQIRAIHIRIYPTKPKAYTVRGTVMRVQGEDVLIAAGAKTVHVLVTSSTRIRVGSTEGSVRDLHVGDKVQIRIQPGDHGLVAVNIHVYRHRATLKHVELRGTLAMVGSGAITVRVGSTSYTVALTRQTVIYVGTAHGSVSSLRAGQSVTIRACCSGERLTATSIHIVKSRVTHSLISLRGRVASLSHGELRLAVGGGTMTILLQASTVYEVGSTRVGASSVRTGDEVSVRAYRVGKALEAERVHIYAAYRRLHTISGTIVAVSGSGLTVVSQGKRYLVATTSRTTISLDGRVVRLTSLRAGDKVRAVGTLDRSTLAATSILASRASLKIKLITIRGTVSRITGSSLVIVDDFGANHEVRLAPGVRIRLHGNQAPGAALFVGVRVSARGRMVGRTLLASTLTLTVKARTVKGRVTQAARGRFLLRTSSRQTVDVDLPVVVNVSDSGQKLTPNAIHNDAYVQVNGYVESSGAVRAVTVNVLHPQLDFSATILARAPTAVARTSRGDRFQLRFSKGTQISTGQEGLALKPTDIPVGAKVHVRGTVRRDGTVAVTQIDVRLVTETLRAAVTAITGQAITLETDTGLVRVRVSDRTVITRASETLSLADLVAGDDVTVYGYNGGPGVVFARKISVHRARIGLDGTVSAVSADGFLLDAGDGSHRVMITSSTVITGGATSTIQVGMLVHVSGYRRGDGAILATSVRIRKGRARE
jgi:hypothetical protein